jgi:DNA invertase Pin-like site-specific DNA recombinase
MKQKTFVCYYRVSTQRQGRSGLGLQAQRKAVEDYLNGGDWKIIEEVTEIESGKNNKRPKLHEAIALCKATGATLIVAKIDRLTRNASFLLSLKDSNVDFVAADLPDANRLTVRIMALVAEQEREAISKRTKDALAAAKASGKQLGAYSKSDKTKFVGRTGTAEDAAKANAARAELFRERAQDKLALLQRYDPEGSMSLRQLAQKFNDNEVPTISGKGSWSANGIRRLKLALDQAS